MICPFFYEWANRCCGASFFCVFAGILRALGIDFHQSVFKTDSYMTV